MINVAYLDELPYGPDRIFSSNGNPKFRSNLPADFIEYYDNASKNHETYLCEGSFADHLDNSTGRFKEVLLEDVYTKEENFLYPISLSHHSDFFVENETINLDSRLVKRMMQGKAKLCFACFTEGWLGGNNIEFVWIDKLVKRYGFIKTSVVMITSNLKALSNYNFLVDKKIIEDTFTVYPFSYFQHDLWFWGDHAGKILQESTFDYLDDYFGYEVSTLMDNSEMGRFFQDRIESNKKKKKSKHFLCFNRVIRPHRVLLFGEIQTNDNLRDKTIITLGPEPEKERLWDITNESLKDNYANSKQKILNFYKTYDSTYQYSYDDVDLRENQATNLNVDAHNTTFINIVTETLTDLRTIFFSEKTFKPILCAQPFVLFGNPFSLLELKKCGFKTFSQWWDESYDYEIDLTRRLEKIVKTLEFISQWDIDKCYRVTQEMESILTNNYNVLMSNQKVLRLHKNLSNFHQLL